jgi:TetR/AcrR family transcriptional regulator
MKRVIQPSTSRGPGRPSKGSLRADLALLDAAQSAFALHGFEGASVRKIAAAAGVNPALAAHYFGSKEALWQAVVKRFAETRGSWVDEVKQLASQKELPIDTRLERAMRQLVKLMIGLPEWGMFISRIAAESGERLDFLVQKLLRPSHDAFIPLLEEAMAAGVIPAQPVEVMYFMLLNAIAMTVSYRNIVEAFGMKFTPEASLESAMTNCLLATFLPATRR